jgi:thymidylate synthase ThyX
LKNLLHFLHLRTSTHAQAEMQLYAKALAKQVELIVPLAYSAFNKESIYHD